mmetsp:Transcript_55093/g.172742  ORF Transcript_55093/g.172742 Transcript_55093/m.172742 type:complete len:208 (+) Transcript_55093:767-1390(+)
MRARCARHARTSSSARPSTWAPQGPSSPAPGTTRWRLRAAAQPRRRRPCRLACSRVSTRPKRCRSGVCWSRPRRSSRSARRTMSASASSASAASRSARARRPAPRRRSAPSSPCTLRMRTRRRASRSRLATGSQRSRSTWRATCRPTTTTWSWRRTRAASSSRRSSGTGATPGNRTRWASPAGTRLPRSCARRTSWGHRRTRSPCTT